MCNDILVDSRIERGSNEGCQASCTCVASVEVRVVFALPVTQLVTRGTPGNLHTPRAIKEFIATLMQLHALPIELLFNEEGFPLHLFDTIFEFRRSPAKHRSERSE